MSSTNGYSPVRGDCDGDRVAADDGLGAAGRDHLGNRVRHRHADHPSLGGEPGVDRGGPEVIALDHPDRADATLLRERDCAQHGVPAHEIPRPVVPVHDFESAASAHDLRRRPRVHFPGREALQVVGHAHDAVRVLAPEIRLNKGPREEQRVVVAKSSLAQERGDVALEGLGVDADFEDVHCSLPYGSGVNVCASLRSEGLARSFHENPQSRSPRALA